MTSPAMGGLEEHILTFIKHFLGTVGYPGIFVLMAIEGFGIPIPSELTMSFSGFLTSGEGGNKMSLPVAITVGALGEVVGAVFAYGLGYWGGRPMLRRYGRLVFVGDDELQRGESWFIKYGDWIVLVSRMLPAVRSFIALPAGVVRMPLWRFVLYSLIGSSIWCAALVLIGHQLGQHWQSIGRDVRRYELILAVIAVGLGGYAIYVRLARRRGTETLMGDEEPSATQNAS